MKTSLILASSSKYRIALLKRLKLDFTAVSPSIDETPLADEKPVDLVKRLSIEKASIVASFNPDSWIIGSDQIALHKDKIIGKSGNQANAIKQLQSFSGSKVNFLTGVSLFHSTSKQCFYGLSTTEVFFKSLTLSDIKNYLKVDSPYDCAGSFKVESLGIALFDRVVSNDPTSLEGLPLITLCKLFEKANIQVF